jgi:hypothetical protein
MLSGEIRAQIDRIWDAFWTGGISNPLEVIEQITYLLFLRRLDELHTLEELKATRLKKPIERRIFPEGKDSKRLPYDPKSSARRNGAITFSSGLFHGFDFDNTMLRLRSMNEYAAAWCRKPGYAIPRFM